MKFKQYIPTSIRVFIRLQKLRKKFKTCKIDTPNVSLSANLGEYVKLARYSSVDDITMGHYSYVGQFTQIVSAEIGAFCSIGEMCSIGSWEHPLNYLTTSPCVAREIINMSDTYNDKPTPVLIGNDVWIGNGVFIRGGKGRQRCCDWCKCCSNK